MKTVSVQDRANTFVVVAHISMVDVCPVQELVERGRFMFLENTMKYQVLVWVAGRADSVCVYVGDHDMANFHANQIRAEIDGPFDEYDRYR